MLLNRKKLESTVKWIYVQVHVFLLVHTIERTRLLFAQVYFIHFCLKQCINKPINLQFDCYDPKSWHEIH